LLAKAGRSARHVERAEEFYRRWGSVAVVIARFIPWIRTFTPILAGVGRMPYPKFLVANVAGALIWGSGLVALGRLAHGSPAIKWFAYAVAGTAVVASLLIPLIARLRRRTAGESVTDGNATTGATRTPERPAPAAGPPDRHPQPTDRS
jgi:membrane-associated protein